MRNRPSKVGKEKREEKGFLILAADVSKSKGEKESKRRESPLRYPDGGEKKMRLERVGGEKREEGKKRRRRLCVFLQQGGRFSGSPCLSRLQKGSKEEERAPRRWRAEGGKKKKTDVDAKAKKKRENSSKEEGEEEGRPALIKTGTALGTQKREGGGEAT